MEFCNGRFTARQDKYQWILTEWREGKDKDGKPKLQPRETYHATLRQVCKTVIDRCAKDCDTAEQVLAMLDKAEDMLTERAEAA